MGRIQTKRVYDPAAAGDGCRILIDRLWPRGLTKEKAKVDLWLRQVAPSGELRKWFAHDPAKWSEFKRRYFHELEGQGEAARQILDRAAKESVTLLFGAKDERHNNAVALKEYLARQKG